MVCWSQNLPSVVCADLRSFYWGRVLISNFSFRGCDDCRSFSPMVVCWSQTDLIFPLGGSWSPIFLMFFVDLRSFPWAYVDLRSFLGDVLILDVSLRGVGWSQRLSLGDVLISDLSDLSLGGVVITYIFLRIILLSHHSNWSVTCIYRHNIVTIFTAVPDVFSAWLHIS